MTRHPATERAPDHADPQVSAAYRDVATERAPAALNRIVLEQAKAAAQRRYAPVFMQRWIRPVAYVATVALTVVLALELTRVPAPEPLVLPNPADRQRETAPDSPPGVRAREETAAATVDDSEDAPRTSAGFAEMIEASSKHMQQTETVTETASGLLENRQAGKSTPDPIVPSGATAESRDEAARACTAREVADPLAWWQCISDLEDDGQVAEAETELRFFRSAYPDFEPPAQP